MILAVNEQERYAEVKRLFLAAIELQGTQRNEFLDQHCDTALRDEVDTLLAHHTCQTILAEDETSVAAGSNPTEQKEANDKPANGKSADGEITQEQMPQVIDQRLVPELPKSWSSQLSPQLAGELIGLLRKRLRGLAIVLTVALLWGLLRSLFDARWSTHASEIFVLAAVAGSWLLLGSSQLLSYKALRTIEAVMMSSTIVLLVRFDVHEISLGGREHDAGRIIGAIDRSQLRWCMLIMIYGIFVPNRWKRAAMFILPTACLPYLIRLSASNSFVYETLELLAYERPVPMPFLAAFTAILATHLFDLDRKRISHARSFAQYRIRRLLGRGGMGNVYEAEHSLLKRPCAVKVIRPERQYDQSTLARFEREVQATARLSHPNTIQIYDYGQTIEGTFYYVMEYLRGMGLNEMIARCGPLPPARVIYLLQQACGALQEAHDAGLIHRDIKPGNLFVCARGGEHDVLKLLDFGLVTTLKDPQLKTTVISGTPPFMAPEQGLGSGQVDARSDIYSLGATTYFLVTGVLPFAEQMPQMQLLAHLTRDVTPPSKHIADLPGDFEKVILRCLEKDQLDRYQNMGELRRALAECGTQGWTGDDAASWWERHRPDANAAE